MRFLRMNLLQILAIESKTFYFGKSAERVDAYRPVAAKTMFGDDTEVEEAGDEVSSEEEE